MKAFKHSFVALVLLATAPAVAGEPVRVERVSNDTLALVRDSASPVNIWLSNDTTLDKGDTLLSKGSKDTRLEFAAATTRQYVILDAGKGKQTVVGERVLPLEQGSNFRDIGGYVTKDGKTVKFGKVYRSGAMPMLTEGDYAFLGALDFGAVVDLRSLEEREITADQLDDRTGALFLSNDYSMKKLLADYMKNGAGENMYAGMEKLLRPQFRMVFNRILADEGAVLYHCSAGQDRTGMTTALIYDALGVDRETILADYHLSTEFRRPQFEMPKIDPADYPGNVMVQMYMAMRKDGETPKAEPLYTKSGHSHLAQFFDYLDAAYGGAKPYLEKELGMTEADFTKLRATLLQ